VIGYLVNPVKGRFFDAPAVIRATTAAQRKVFSRFGYRVRQTARRSIRTRMRPAKPGQAPTNRTGRLKGSIFFAYEPHRRTVVIGPTRFPRSTMAQEVLEHGGRPQVGRSRKGASPHTFSPGETGPVLVQKRRPRKRRKVGTQWGRGADGRDRKYYVVRVKLRTRAQADRATRLQDDYLVIGPKTIKRLRPRPYMGPAFEQEKPALPGLWQDSLRK